MNYNLDFTFIDTSYNCNVYIDISEDPRFIFVVLLNKELISSFGTDITIETDFEILIRRDDDYADLVAIRQAIFNALQQHPEFITAKQKADALRDVNNLKYRQRT